MRVMRNIVTCLVWGTSFSSFLPSFLPVSLPIPSFTSTIISQHRLSAYHTAHILLSIESSKVIKAFSSKELTVNEGWVGMKTRT